jgi:hypothetical protein
LFLTRFRTYKIARPPQQKHRRGGGLRQINTCRKVSLLAIFFRYRHLALLSISLIFLPHRERLCTFNSKECRSRQKSYGNARGIVKCKRQNDSQIPFSTTKICPPFYCIPPTMCGGASHPSQRDNRNIINIPCDVNVWGGRWRGRDSYKLEFFNCPVRGERADHTPEHGNLGLRAPTPSPPPVYLSSPSISSPTLYRRTSSLFKNVFLFRSFCTVCSSLFFPRHVSPILYLLSFPPPVSLNPSLYFLTPILSPSFSQTPSLFLSVSPPLYMTLFLLILPTSPHPFLCREGFLFLPCNN